MTDTRLKSIAFFGGGSGGHLFPGIAVAERARDRFPGFEALFFRSGRAVEEKVFGATSFSTRSMSVHAPRALRDWPRYTLDSWSAVRELRPVLRDNVDAVVGLGGYASLAGVLAAKREGIPVVLLEQNEVPGKVNRLLSRFVGCISCPSESAASKLPGRTEVTGNPVRSSVLDALEDRRQRRAGEKKTVVVVGGSQGARGLNRVVRDAVSELAEYRDRIAWFHVTGKSDAESFREFYSSQGWEAEVCEFCDDLPRRMAAADLVLSRSGGTTLAELAVLGVPSVLVPYPHHRDQHQVLNARAMERAGGAVVLSEDQFDARSLRTVFETVLFSPANLQEMENRLRDASRLDAADRVINLLLELRQSCRQDFAFSS